MINSKKQERSLATTVQILTLIAFLLLSIASCESIFGPSNDMEENTEEEGEEALLQFWRQK